ncbi:MAG: NADH-quinone oxidoreductase subunit NuoK [candidate division WOR-3 bacterium]
MTASTIWLYDLVVVAILFVIGLAGLVVMRNLIKLLIALEVLTKAVSLALVASGYAQRNPHLMQAVVVTLIVVEVVVVAVALALIISIYRRTGSLDIRKLTRLKW